MSVSVVMVRAWAAAVVQTGGDVASFLAAAGVAPNLFDDPFARIEVAAYDRVQELAVSITGDEALGLHVGERVAAFTFGTVGHLAAECQTLREAIEVFASYYTVLTETPPPTIEELGDQVFLRHDFPRASPVVNRVRAEFALTAFLGTGRTFVGNPEMVPDEVWLEHDAPGYADEYRRVFGVAASFGRAKTGLLFPRALLGARRYDRDRKLYEVLRSEADFRLAMAREESVVARVRDLASYAEGNERPTMQEIARRILVSERSLRRMLANEGRTFRSVVDEAMRDRALRLLRDTSLTVAQVAERSGFREVSTFHRAVRRWTSRTVRELRKAHDES